MYLYIYKSLKKYENKIYKYSQSRIFISFFNEICLEWIKYIYVAKNYYDN